MYISLRYNSTLNERMPCASQKRPTAVRLAQILTGSRLDLTGNQLLPMRPWSDQPSPFLGFQAGTPDFSGKLAKPVLVRVVAKQLFYGTGTPLAEIPGLHSQNMRDKPCRIVSAAGNFACDLFRQNFRGFRLTTPSRRALAMTTTAG